MDKYALGFAVLAIIIFSLFRLESKLSRILEELENANQTLASILDEVEK
jgi:hypothetical protein